MPAHHAKKRPLSLQMLAITRAMSVLCASIGRFLTRCSGTFEKLSASEPIKSVEAIDRVSVGALLAGLVVHGLTEEDAAVCSELCLPGEAIEVSEATGAA